MRLSEAIMLGSTTCRMVAVDMSSCALGAACNALGVPEHTQHYLDNPGGYSRYAACQRIWPWLAQTLPGQITNDYMREVYRRFDRDVVAGSMTLEQLADYVKTVEPACGDCCKFTCTCVQKMDETPTYNTVTEEVVCTS